MDIVYPEGTKIDETVPENVRHLYQRFYIGPINRGFGHTLGNSLRRVLLSSMEGYAIIALKIDGVPHEFSTIEGVRDDVALLILHLKKVRLKIKGNKSLVRAEIKVDNSKSQTSYIIKASDIQGPVEVINPDQYITELMPKYKFNCEIFVAKGRGYIPAERIGSIFELPAGAIPIDAIFNPIVKVNYEVRKTLYKDRVDYDELVLDIWSDGTITPQEAYEESIEILTDYLEGLKNYIERAEYEMHKREIKVSTLEEFLSRNVEELNLPRKAADILLSYNIKTVRELVKMTDKELLSFPSLGRRSLREIREVLNRAGLRLGMTDEDIQQLIEAEKKRIK
ncbi:MAG: DNA-directed RNA polymerase subunit alpha [Candidatus Calescibacterium sp.]|nr:DNA-directed RNA polymerase subunit alpha [Candidatus Calescibacterium sp.]MCX7733835.1 DNA-directed RNA polymerase subunit alpha [bacterium]MDW8086616.1 DNA-directed RNA polymerase subunit alpha [Candidatus Calescibacterium sp.]